MITLAWYLLKVIVCSGILCGYYYMALRNKIFHRWNRFYLLASVILALVVPLMKINIFQSNGEDKGTVIRMLQTINSGDEIVIEYSRHSALQLNSENIISTAYLLITTIFLTVFFFALYKIYRLKKKYPETKMKGINFISTNAKGTPFSFFKSIFWNNAIDLHSRNGQQIFNHEIAHVKEKHSYDKIFMNVVLIFFWLNPFFWLMRKELSMIHEFIADKEALEDSDMSAFAEMVLQTVYPGQNFSLTNNFFHSPLKRRIIMFTKNKNPKVSYISRLLALPLAAIIFFAFSLKMKATATNYVGKKITVIIDAGHGGNDNGAVANNINEKDLNLAIAKDVKEMNTNPNLNIILLRDKDINIPVKDRAKIVNEQKPDLFISIHVDANASNNDASGLTVIIPKNDNAYLKQSQLVGSAIVESFKNNYALPVADDLEQLEHGVWILKAIGCPAILIETGFLTNRKDVSYLIDPKNQRTIAKNILAGIEKYANEKVTSYNNVSSIQTTESSNSILDSLPDPLYVVNGKIVTSNDVKKIDNNDIQSVNVLKGESAIKKYGDKGKNGVIEINKKIPNQSTQVNVKIQPIYMVNGKELSKEELNKISAASIQSISVLKDESAIKKYGERGKNGVVEIILKPVGSSALNATPVGTSQNDSVPDKVFTKVENEASFPGGQPAWLKYISKKIEASIDSFSDKDYGTCLIKFVVNTDGSVSNVEATTMEGTQLAKVSVNAVKEGPLWIPASQNGQTVAAYRLQPVTLTNPEEKKK
jgi:N-acetylmuramoyl-L-alanine amidase